MHSYPTLNYIYIYIYIIKATTLQNKIEHVRTSTSIKFIIDKYKVKKLYLSQKVVMPSQNTKSCKNNSSLLKI
jgi:hypothetical protein